MDAMLTFLHRFGASTLGVLFESAIYVVFGFVVAGLLHVYLPTERIVRHLRGRGFRAVVSAAALGAPLPLCSCGVVPSAVELRRRGASREATMSFLISTPETSADSIALSWGLLGPVFALVRPMVAVVSALVGGLMHFAWGRAGGCDAGAAEPAACPDAGCGCAADAAVDDDACGMDHTTANHGERLAHGLRYSFLSLFDELAFWFVIGIILTGFITAIVPDGFLARSMHHEFLSLLLAAALGIPLYMCASSSTPVAAALLAKGLSPGAALVFLLTGPATNAATMSILARTFGRRFLGIYLGAIAGTAIVAGFVLNRLYHPDLSLLPVSATAGMHEPAAWLKLAGVAIFLVLLVNSISSGGFRAGWRELSRNAAVVASFARGHRGPRESSRHPGRAATRK